MFYSRPLPYVNYISNGFDRMGDQNETEQLLRNLTELSPHIFHTAYWTLKTNSAIWFTIKWFCLKKKSHER